MSRENTNQKIRYLLIPFLMAILFIALASNTIIALADGTGGNNGGTGGNSGGTTSGKGGFEDWRQGYRIYVVDGAGTQQAAPVDVLVQYSPDGIPNYETYTRISNLHATEEHTFSELGLDTLGMPVPIYEGTDGAYHANGTTLQTWMLSPSSVNPSYKNATMVVYLLYGADFMNNNWLSGGDRYLILEPITYHKNFESGQWCYGTFWNWMGFYGGSGASNFTASIDKRLLGNGFVVTSTVLGLNSPVTEEKYWTWNKVLSGNYGVGIHVYYNKGTEEIPETPTSKNSKSLWREKSQNEYNHPCIQNSPNHHHNNRTNHRFLISL